MYTNTPMTYMMNLLKINQVQKSLLFFHFFLDFYKLADIYLQPKFNITHKIYTTWKKTLCTERILY